MDRSASTFISSSTTPTNLVLKTFNLDRYQSGVWAASYPWQFICTATYRDKRSRAKAENSFFLFIDRFKRELAKAVGIRDRFPIAYAAVMERRAAGLGMPAIASHWHFVFAVPQRLQGRANTIARLLWMANGDIKIAPYHPHLGGAHYLAKLVGNSDFQLHFDNLDRLTDIGPTDLFIAQQTDPYVPEHFKHAMTGETMAMRRSDGM